MFSDNCEAIRVFGGSINYYIDDIRVTRERFHLYRALTELTDFRKGEFALPWQSFKNYFTIGHWVSIVDTCTSEYLNALDKYPPYYLDVQSSFHCCGMELRDRFMTIKQINCLYHRGEERIYKEKSCPQKRFVACATCKQAPEDIRTCIDMDEREKSDRTYYQMMNRDLQEEMEKLQNGMEYDETNI